VKPIAELALLVMCSQALLCDNLAAQESVPPPCPGYSTFEIVNNPEEFADLCFLADFMRQPDADEKVTSERDIDLDNEREILERRPSTNSLFTYYVFENSEIGPLYKGFLIAPGTFRVRKLRADHVVVEYTVKDADNRSIRERLEYRNGNWEKL